MMDGKITKELDRRGEEASKISSVTKPPSSALRLRATKRFSRAPENESSTSYPIVRFAKFDMDHPGRLI